MWRPLCERGFFMGSCASVPDEKAWAFARQSARGDAGGAERPPCRTGGLRNAEGPKNRLACSVGQRIELFVREERGIAKCNDEDESLRTPE